jgi:hypothetical protein
MSVAAIAAEPAAVCGGAVRWAHFCATVCPDLAQRGGRMLRNIAKRAVLQPFVVGVLFAE